MIWHSQTAESVFNVTAIAGAGIFVLLTCAAAFGQQTVPVGSERDRGKKLYDSGNTDEAIKALSAVVKTNKTDGEAWYFLGLAWNRAHNSKKARKAFEAAVKLRPDFAAAHTGFAYTLMLTGKNADAGREARRAIELDQNDAEAHYILGVIHLREFNHSTALEEAETAIRVKSEFANAYLLKYEALIARYAERFDAPRKRPNDTSKSTPLDPAVIEAQRARDMELFTRAGDAIETYLKLNPADKSTFWREQREALRAYSQEDKAVFRSSEVDTRVRVLIKPEPSYTPAARNADITGTVIFRSKFTAQGTVEDLLVIRYLPYGLTEQALEAARKIKFIPATKDGKPVSMFMQLEYNFNLY
jgi:TonB family protein